jgi:hypothetical protein
MFCGYCDDEKQSARLQMGVAGSQSQQWHGKHAENSRFRSVKSAGRSLRHDSIAMSRHGAGKCRCT